MKFKLSLVSTTFLIFAVMVTAFAYWGGIPPLRAFSKSLSPEALNQEKVYERATVTARRIFKQHGFSSRFSEQVGHYAVDSGLPARLVAAQVIVESGGHPLAVSKAGAVGLLQVMPKIWNISPEALKDPDTNLRVGTAILAHHIRAYGTREGLRHYFGKSEGSHASELYADRVLSVAGEIR
jgi:soluble lytic murein transglycosylase-like protein